MIFSQICMLASVDEEIDDETEAECDGLFVSSKDAEIDGLFR